MSRCLSYLHENLCLSMESIGKQESVKCNRLSNQKVTHLRCRLFKMGILSLWVEERVYVKYMNILGELCVSSVTGFLVLFFVFC